MANNDGTAAPVTNQFGRPSQEKLDAFVAQWNRWALANGIAIPPTKVFDKFEEMVDYVPSTRLIYRRTPTAEFCAHASILSVSSEIEQNATMRRLCDFFGIEIPAGTNSSEPPVNLQELLNPVAAKPEVDPDLGPPIPAREGFFMNAGKPRPAGTMIDRRGSMYILMLPEWLTPIQQLFGAALVWKRI